MKAIFVDYFNVSISCCILIAAVILLRMILKRAPRAMVCALWFLVFLRLAVPFRVESDWSLRPTLPVVTEESTGIFFESKLIPESSIPDLVPRARATFSFGDWTARIDYVQIASWVWLIGLTLTLVYILFSYVAMRFRLRDAVRVQDRVFVSEKVSSGFLLGYFRPRIYLPSQLDEKSAQLVIAHEHAHLLRGDHWLKLFAFVCLALHWYNPLVWVAYGILCADIEYACDEKVIGSMDEAMRVEYSAVLLSMGKGKKCIPGVSLPFGESSIRRRIVTVLNYRRPAKWFCVSAAVMVFLCAVFLVTDPVPEYPPHYRQLTQLLGQSKETVEESLHINLLENEDSAMTGYYDTPLWVEYKGVPFDIVLGFSIVDDRLWGFQYVAIYENDLQKAAEDTVTIAQHLQKTYGRARQNGNKRTLWLSEIEVDAVLDKFANRYLQHEGIDAVRGFWQLSEVVEPETRSYWESLIASDLWPQYLNGRNVELDFGLDLNAWNDPDSENTYLCLDFDTKYAFKSDNE